MKIKTFTSFLNDAETAINKFLEDKKFVDIKTNAVIHNGKIFTHYTVVYEEKTDMLPENLKGKTLENMNDNGSVYVREKGSKGDWQKVGGLLKEIGDSVRGRTNMMGQADYGSGESISIPVSVNPAHHDSSNFIDRAYEKKLMSIHSPTGYIDVTDSKYKVADDIKNRMGRFE